MRTVRALVEQGVRVGYPPYLLHTMIAVHPYEREAPTQLGPFFEIISSQGGTFFEKIRGLQGGYLFRKFSALGGGGIFFEIFSLIHASFSLGSNSLLGVGPFPLGGSLVYSYIGGRGVKRSLFTVVCKCCLFQKGGIFSLQGVEVSLVLVMI